MNEEKRVWGIHSQDDGLFLNRNLIAMRWKEFGDLSKLEATREAFKEHYAEVYPDVPKGNIPTGSGMLFRFIHEVQIGDYIVFPSKGDRKINIGTVEGEYFFEEHDGEYVQRRKVKWLKHIPRTSFSQGALHEVGSAMTLFMVKNYADEYLAALDKGFTGSVIDNIQENEAIAATAKDIAETTEDFIIKVLSKNLKGYDLEPFIANLLEAMGYRTVLSPQGGDRGIDITAYKDELPPRILVQVKSGDSPVREDTVQSLKGALKDGDYGLFITLSEYTKNAQTFLADSPIIKGINGSELAGLVMKYYDNLNEKYRKMIPLERIYIPVAKEVEQNGDQR